MEIKSIQTSSKLSQVHTSAKAMLDFKNGEIIFAEIVSIDGETITLRTKDDTLFTAQVMSDLKLFPGDDLKLAVKGSKNGRLVMQALSVNADVVDISAEEPVMRGETKQLLLVANLLKSIDIPPTTAVINEIMTVLEENPALDPRTAVFLAANAIEINEENIVNIKQVETGAAPIADRLLDILNHIAADGLIPEDVNKETILKLLDPSGPYQGLLEEPVSTAAPASKPAVISIAANDSFYMVLPAKTTRVPLETQFSVRPEIPSEAAKPEAPAPEIMKSAESVKMTVENIFAQSAEAPPENTQNPQPEAVPAEHQIAADAARGLLQDKSLGPVLEKLVSLFSDIKGLKDGSTDIEKENRAKIEKLVELKEAIKSSDIKNREVLAEKTDKIISQNKLFEDIARYNMYHVPINTGRGRQTAEVYVYQRKRNKKDNKAGAEVNILIGLDTQNLGRFEVLLKANGKSLSVTMGRDSDKAREIIELRAKKLEKAFSEMGFSLSEFKMERLHERTTPVNAEEVLTGKAAPSSFRIDYTV